MAYPVPDKKMPGDFRAFLLRKKRRQELHPFEHSSDTLTTTDAHGH
jgi:hypothetical protein